MSLLLTPPYPLLAFRLTAVATAERQDHSPSSLSFFHAYPLPRRRIIERTGFPLLSPLKSLSSPKIIDEWGKEEEISEAATSEQDPPKEDAFDEWGGSVADAASAAVDEGNGTAVSAFASTTPSVSRTVEEKKKEVRGGLSELEELKRCLVDTVYGSELGFKASWEVRAAEVLELVNQLEAKNPSPEPVQSPGLLDGNWVLV